MWLLVALVTDTVPWEHPGARSSLPAASVPARHPSCLPVAPGGCRQSPRPACGQPCRPGCAFSHRALLVFQPAPWDVHHSPPSPPRLCRQLSHGQSPPGWPCHQIRCHHGAWVHGTCGCSGCGSVLGEILLFHGCFCPPATFLATFPPPLTPQLPGCSPHAVGASPAMGHHPGGESWEALCRTGDISILISPLLTPKGLSRVLSVGGYPCPVLPPRPSHGGTQPLRSPTQHLLVHSPGAVPAPSQTLT